MRRHTIALVALVVTVILTTGVSMAQNEAEFGNNLSVPAVFAEGYGLGGERTTTSNGLRGQMGMFNINDATPTTCFDTVGNPVTPCYLQQTISEWQAESVDGAPAKIESDGKRTPGEAVIVNWSDNLISQRWTPQAPVRVEVVLYQNQNESFPTFGGPMTGFSMLYNSGKGSTEMWGTDGNTTSSTYRTVFSTNARLKIEKLNLDGTTIDAATTAACGFNGAIWEAFGQDGPGFYVAEINVSGNLIYGFNWMLNRCDSTTAKLEGKWRLTFSLDPTATLPGGTTVEPNVTFASLDPADTTIDESERAPYATPVLVDGSTSVMDIQIVAPKGGGGSSRKTETEFGNNLAVPAVFAEGYGLGGERTTTSNGLRGQVGLFNGNGVAPVICYDTAGLPVPSCYLQQTAADWQAHTVDGAPATTDPLLGRTPGEGVIVNWSDNLISQRWTASAPVRVEVVLYQNQNAGFPTFGGPMTGFNMLYNSGKGSTEMWGTNAALTSNTYRTVFSINARLKIEKLNLDGSIDALTTAACGFNGSIWEGFGKDGPGFYVAEVNVSGNLIYGFNWMLNRCDATVAKPEGPWRLTFSLDPTAIALDGTAVQSNVTLVGLDPADITSTDGERAPYATPILENGSTSVLNIQIVSARGGGSSRRPR